MRTLKVLGTVGLLLLLVVVVTILWGPDTEDSSSWEAVSVVSWGLGGFLLAMAALGIMVERRNCPPPGD